MEGQDRETQFKAGTLNHEIELRYIGLKQEHNILGVWISPNGNKCKQVQKIKEKTRERAKNMDSSGMPAYFKELSYNIKLWPQLSYAI